MKHYKFKKIKNDAHARVFITDTVLIKKPKFPRIVFWKIKKLANSRNSTS